MGGYALRRIHVERAIGAMKMFDYVNTLHSARDLSTPSIAVQTCAFLANLLNPPFCARSSATTRPAAALLFKAADDPR